MIRSILVTEIEDKKGKLIKSVYGRYDPVKMSKYFERFPDQKIRSSEIVKYEMDDETFALYGKRKETKRK